MVVSYFGLLGAAVWLGGSPWVLAPVLLLYLTAITANVPPRVAVACVVVAGGLAALVVALPPWPLWLYLALIPLCHFLQNVSHRVWTRAEDMARFNAKYQKGFVLFLLLSLYELPILLNYLVFDPRRWSR